MMHLPRTLRRQRGVAVVTALLLTTLAVTIVASLFWQQQVQVRSVENQRLHLQTRWILRGALDWARLILRQDGIDSRGGATRADGVWATPLAETRLDQYVERERVEGEDYDATLQGRIYDAQSRYNLTNLADATATSGEVRAFAQLLTLLQLDAGLAQSAAQYAAKAQAAAGQAGTGSAPMAFQRVEDLLAVGFPQAAVERLRDYVVVLPEATAVNVNTAPAEVLAATVEGMPLSEAQSLVASRKRTALKVEDVKNGRNPLTKLDERSDYFLVLSQVRLDRAALESWSLIHRMGQSRAYQTSVMWIREI
ncbi:type II secretion system minor pseudopilin GspK [Pseudoduganella umbonata]|uniref:Type II secretion system protein K n=1 Tax=Pseudoduganella umbonata TaxID=864828 RepID=A0A4P8HVJ4_9BURK|nr:type II secretion system minor pseudopilin GspK [Pseudoduganella umbonata]MBB3223734.1 general secretion pathway protein K [Pseudoduganella umbonata]QCP12838.1 general secretion pathway protein GspK [Pseudoduganella umbonata]